MSTYSPAGAAASVHFCSKCGCHITCIDKDEDHAWYITPSITNDEDHAFFKFRCNAFTTSAADGGLSNMLKEVGGKPLPSWNPPDTDDRSKLVVEEAEVGADGEPRLRAKCRCGGVSFTIKRPSEQVLANDVLNKFVSPMDKTKWLACLDICNDCRLVTGTHVIGWCFVALSACEPPISSDLQIGTSKTYSSSPGVLRSFCGDCGATVFYSCKERMKEGHEAVDVAIGLLRAPEGPLADNWVTWRSRIAHLPSGYVYDKDYAGSLQEGMDKWSMEKYGKTTDFNIG